MVKRIKSLIKENIPDELMARLTDIFNARSNIWIPAEDFDYSSKKLHLKVAAKKDGKVNIKLVNNNDKINLSKMYIIKYLGECNFATGTNRFVAVYKGYVYKIAQDREGVTDNYHEFYMSKIITPYVTKCYETNGLISVCEYIQVINTDIEFQMNKSNILKTLERLSEITSLMLDVGYTPKNRTNWGIRPSTNECIPLDYGYIYTDIDGIKLTCTKDKCIKAHGITKLKYTDDFSKLVCPMCGYEYTDTELHGLVNEEARKKMYDHFKDSRSYPLYKVTKPVSYFEFDSFGDPIEKHGVRKEDIVEEKKVIKITRQEAQEIVYKYIDLYDKMEYYKKLDSNPSENDLQYLEAMRRTLIEYKYNQRYENLTDEEKSFEPRWCFKSKTKHNKYRNTQEFRFNNEIYELVKKEYPNIKNKTAKDIAKQLMDDEIYLEDVFKCYNRSQIFEDAQEARNTTLIDSLDDSVIDDIMDRDEDTNKKASLLGKYEYTGNYDNSGDKDDDLIDDTGKNTEGGPIELFESTVVKVNGEFKIDYVYIDNISEAQAETLMNGEFSDEVNIDKLKNDNPNEEFIVGVYRVGNRLYIDYQHKGFVRVEDGVYDKVEGVTKEELLQTEERRDSNGFIDEDEGFWTTDDEKEAEMLNNSINDCRSMNMGNKMGY